MRVRVKVRVRVRARARVKVRARDKVRVRIGVGGWGLGLGSPRCASKSTKYAKAVAHSRGSPSSHGSRETHRFSMARAALSKAGLSRVSKWERPAWDPACSSGVRGLCSVP